MIDRRSLVIGGTTIVLAGYGISAPMKVGRLQAWAMRTGPGPGLPQSYPLDHTAVVGVTTSKQWGCFGRTAAEDGEEKRIIAEADGDELWATEIGGADGSAGIELDVTGACQQCSNRLLLPAGIDVNKAHGNEITTPLFGKYGFGIPALVTRIKDGAHAVNQNFPGRISDRAVAAAVKHVQVNNTEEWSVVEGYLESLFRPSLGPDWPACKADLSHVYYALYNYREALFSQYSKGHITKADFVTRLQGALSGAIQLVAEIVTPSKSNAAVAILPEVQAAFVLHNN
ncbi:hypothetical protein RFM41_29755 [Mesorhizobium sp. VK25A]|uniref:Uncharacterized protein n=1 Tax=Mesorhizobium vachelliae TaxID=3072309 RepID=A0ABU5ABU0_9HYPH|nr:MULTISPECIES: hypothetical protein [unclassified Mesorhizobium]MDX8535186.1 hypothetical protein [Mesorhizobium sp. VK25D]MDX8547962.1 hypothetical protein [Mesorhizobium sp. VK25A]